MGNTTSGSGVPAYIEIKLGKENEMVELIRSIKPPDSVRTLDELSHLSSTLEENVRSLSLFIDSVVFDDINMHHFAATVDDIIPKTRSSKELARNERESQQVSQKLREMIHLLHQKIHYLTIQLDFHSRQMKSCTSCEYNAKLLSCVVSLVNNVNSYTKLLFRKVIKFSIFWFGSVGSPALLYDLKYNCRPIDVIESSNDIDTMLINLIKFGREIGSLQKDVISILELFKTLNLKCGSAIPSKVYVYFLSDGVLKMYPWLALIPGWTALHDMIKRYNFA